MDDTSDLADQSNEMILVTFKVSVKNLAIVCLYIFHIIYPTKSVWPMILSQTKNFNIFPSTI